jgi:hypothetical protein
VIKGYVRDQLSRWPVGVYITFGFLIPFIHNAKSWLYQTAPWSNQRVRHSYKADLGLGTLILRSHMHRSQEDKISLLQR